MSQFADLHIHTHYSDGTMSPQEVIAEAVHLRLACISITDHDTIDAIPPAFEEISHRQDIELVPGLEFSSELNGKDIHLLAYFIDVNDPVLIEELKLIQNSRIVRIEAMIQKLKTLGIDNISLDEVCSLSRSKSVGRPHLAMQMVKKGWVSSLREAFDRYLAEDRPGYVEKRKKSPYEVIQLIKKSKGAAVIAHPLVTARDELIPSFVEAGLDGIEVYYPNYSPTTIQYYLGLAQKHRLVVTGGSDAHGAARDNTYIGKVKIPYVLVEALREKAARG